MKFKETNGEILFDYYDVNMESEEMAFSSFVSLVSNECFNIKSWRATDDGNFHDGIESYGGKTKDSFFDSLTFLNGWDKLSSINVFGSVDSVDIKIHYYRKRIKLRVDIPYQKEKIVPFLESI